MRTIVADGHKYRLVEKRNFYLRHLRLAPLLGVIPSEFRRDLLRHKTRVPALSCGNAGYWESHAGIRSTIRVKWRHRIRTGKEVLIAIIRKTGLCSGLSCALKGRQQNTQQALTQFPTSLSYRRQTRKTRCLTPIVLCTKVDARCDTLTTDNRRVHLSWQHLWRSVAKFSKFRIWDKVPLFLERSELHSNTV